jgi:hypothetical protein
LVFMETICLSSTGTSKAHKKYSIRGTCVKGGLRDRRVAAIPRLRDRRLVRCGAAGAKSGAHIYETMCAPPVKPDGAVWHTCPTNAPNVLGGHDDPTEAPSGLPIPRPRLPVGLPKTSPESLSYTPFSVGSDITFSTPHLPAFLSLDNRSALLSSPTPPN